MAPIFRSYDRRWGFFRFVFATNTCYIIFVANTLTLIQARLPTKQVKKLDRLMKEAGVLTRAEFLRQIVNGFIAEKEPKKEK